MVSLTKRREKKKKEKALLCTHATGCVWVHSKGWSRTSKTRTARLSRSELYKVFWIENNVAAATSISEQRCVSCYLGFQQKGTENATRRLRISVYWSSSSRLGWMTTWDPVAPKQVWFVKEAAERADQAASVWFRFHTERERDSTQSATGTKTPPHRTDLFHSSQNQG